MEVKLIKLELTNYRNIKHQILNFDGSSKIVGENRIGKTNTIEAIYYLLTDRLLNGSTDIDQLKPLTDTKAKVMVYGTFQVGDKTIELGKEYQEEWVKTRGTEDLVFKGHSTTYFYQGVKQGTKLQYDSLFNKDFGINVEDEFKNIDIVQMLINPLYLGKMGDSDKWKVLRTFIIDIVGDVQDNDVFDADPKLLPIKEDLERNFGRTDQVIKQYRDTIKGIEESIIGVDANISMLEKAEEPNEDVVIAARIGIEDCDTKIHNLKHDDNCDEAINLIDKEINALRSQIIDIKRKDLEEKNSNPQEKRRSELLDKRNALLEDSQDLSSTRFNTFNDYNNLKNEIDNNQKAVLDMNVTRHNLMEEIDSIDNQLANPIFEKECPHCHRPYDEKEINEIRNRVLADLSQKRAGLVSQGKENTEKMNELAKKVENDKVVLDKLGKTLDNLKSSQETLKGQIDSIDKELELLNTPMQGTVSVNPQIIELENKILSKEQEKANIRKSNDDKEESVRQLIAAEQEKKDAFLKIVSDYEFFARTKSQIKEKKVEKETLSKKLISYEQKVELVKAFVNKKLVMLDDHITKVFGDVSFMLIEPQINGGYSTVCKPYIKGTKTLWKSGSKSEQITTGVAIVEKIKAALNLPDFPYLFDEGGEISSDTFNTRFNTKSQLICVQVRDNINLPTVMKI